MNKEDWLNLPSSMPRNAFAWECSNCDVTNYGSYVLTEFGSKEEEMEANLALGIEPWMESQIVHVPRTLTCRDCGTKHRNAEIDPEVVEQMDQELWEKAEDEDFENDLP